MKRILCMIPALLVTLAPMTATAQKNYSSDKVVYDVSSPDVGMLTRMLDRASLLQRLYRNDSFSASIVLVVHEGAIPLFLKNGRGHAALMQRAADLTLGEIIRFRLCLASARMQGFSRDDFHPFVEFVPMADAELIELQQNGYAYLR